MAETRSSACDIPRPLLGSGGPDPVCQQDRRPAQRGCHQKGGATWTGSKRNQGLVGMAGEAETVHLPGLVSILNCSSRAEQERLSVPWAWASSSGCLVGTAALPLPVHLKKTQVSVEKFLLASPTPSVCQDQGQYLAGLGGWSKYPGQDRYTGGVITPLWGLSSLWLMLRTL